MELIKKLFLFSKLKYILSESDENDGTLIGICQVAEHAIKFINP